jgi:hypothetical protein
MTNAVTIGVARRVCSANAASRSRDTDEAFAIESSQMAVGTDSTLRSCAARDGTPAIVASMRET